MRSIILYNLVLCILLTGCTNKQKHSTIIGGADGTTEILIANNNPEIKDSSVVDSTAQKYDIDAPIPLSEIEQYNKRVTLKRMPNVSITHPDAYKIRTQKPVYTTKTEQITLDVINVDAPSAEPEYHWMEQWENGKWTEFPFIDNLGFAGVGRDLSKGDTLPEHISMSEFKNLLEPNKYKVHFYVFANIYTYCTITDNSIQPVKNSEMKGAFNFHVLDSKNDSLRILFENHTNLSVQPVFLPSVGTDELYSVHPYARSGWVGEAEWMKSHALLKGGEAMLFSLPVSWDINRLQTPHDKENFKAGKLTPGKYKIGLQIEVYMETEFNVEYSPIPLKPAEAT